MQRRKLLRLGAGLTGAALLTAHAPGWAQGVARRAAGASDRILVLVELKGGNDGLNTIVPYGDPLYAQLRPTIAIPGGDVLRLDAGAGLHPALQPLLPLWEKNQLAIVQGVGYPQPNLSHFRSIEIWETASRSNEYLSEGWLARGVHAGFGGGAALTAEGVRIGSSDLGPLAGARAVSLNDPQAFVDGARLASPRALQGNPALQHLLSVEADISHAADGLRAERYPFAAVFPAGAFGNGVRAAAQVVASQRGRAGVPVITL
ncbi:MAG: Twin-arginine translocation pathway signal sequence domain-containing protein, partial [Pseudomonadota bacterium]|nr:Twin-arginine translocation pathway signal sequence domain-containing protein [Pseudomonadota bacterium]